MRSRRWDQLSGVQKLLVVTLTSVQVSLAATAWVDLAQRPTEQVNGPKPKWAAVIAINFVGPIAYFLRGRSPSRPPSRRCVHDPPGEGDLADEPCSNNVPF